MSKSLAGVSVHVGSEQLLLYTWWCFQNNWTMLYSTMYTNLVTAICLTLVHLCIEKKSNNCKLDIELSLNKSPNRIQLLFCLPNILIPGVSETRYIKMPPSRNKNRASSRDFSRIVFKQLPMRRNNRHSEGPDFYLKQTQTPIYRWFTMSMTGIWLVWYHHTPLHGGVVP